MFPRTMCCISHIKCHMSHVWCHLSGVSCQVSPVRCHMSGVMCHISLPKCQSLGPEILSSCSPPSICHMSHILYNMSSVMHHMSCFPFSLKKSVEASWWRVLRDLPCLVYKSINYQIITILMKLHCNGKHLK